MYDPDKHAKNLLLDELQQLHQQLSDSNDAPDIPVLNDFLVKPAPSAPFRTAPRITFNPQPAQGQLEKIGAEVMPEVTPLIIEEVTRRLSLRLREQSALKQAPKRPL